MQKWEYKVESIEAQVSEGDIRQGLSGKKIATQVELKIMDLSEAGYDFYGQYPVEVNVSGGCFGNKDMGSITVLVLVFRRQLQ